MVTHRVKRTRGIALSSRQRRKTTPPAPPSAHPRAALPSAAAARRKDIHRANRAFNQFLKIGRRDQTLVGRYRRVLGSGAREFSKIFYDYLLEHAATAEVLRQFKARGGEIDTLVAKQTRHLHDLLKARADESSAARMARIGELHHRHRIAPVWIMGAYLRYLDHLLGIVHYDPRIRNVDRARLEDAVTKLLFRDMGLMLEGYWIVSNHTIAAEHAKLVQLQGHITDLLANIPQLLWSVDVERNEPIYISPASREICGLDIELPIPCLGWTVPEERQAVEAAWQRALAGEQVEVETRVQQPGGPLRWFRRIFHPYRVKRGRVTRIDGVMEDITESRALTDRLQTLATTDSLTGLPNRVLFQDRLRQAVATAAREPERTVVVLLMDLDNFKDINDTLGHPAGDRVLIEVAQRLTRQMREGDTVTRLGGDEFAILLPAVKAPERTAEKVAGKLLASLAAPVKYDDSELYVGASVGISIYPQHGEDAATLLSRADVAMYACKNRDTRYMFYDRTLAPRVQERLHLSNELRQALARRQFEVFFQPKVSLRDQRVTGAEALLRWRHPSLGLVQPSDFIPLAERAGVIGPITDWVLETALERCRGWRAGGHPLRVSVNVSGRVFHDARFVERAQRILKASGVPEECLEIEIIENVLMSDVEHVARALRALHANGVRISIDDFGTGYSSLAYLKQLPLHELKIDRSFVRDMASDANDAAIVHAIVDLGHNLGREVVAEGVENAEVIELLGGYGCDAIQGDYIGKAMPEKEFAAWLRGVQGSPGHQ